MPQGRRGRKEPDLAHARSGEQGRQATPAAVASYSVFRGRVRNNDRRTPGEEPGRLGAGDLPTWVFGSLTLLLLVCSLSNTVLTFAALFGIYLFVLGLVLCQVLRSPEFGLLSATSVFLILYASVETVFFVPFFDPGLRISAYSQRFQVPDRFPPAAQLGILGLAAFAFGWSSWSRRQRRRHAAAPAVAPQVQGYDDLVFGAEPLRFWVTLVIGVVFLVMAAPRETFLSVGYANVQSLTSIRLNVLRSGGNLQVLLALLLCIRRPSPLRWGAWLLVALFAMVYVGFLSGNRVETLGLLIALAVAMQRWRKKRAPIGRTILVSVLLVAILQVVGQVRMGFRRSLLAILVPFSGNLPLSFTQGDVALTTVITMNLVKNEVLHTDGGMIFLNILKATFPVFITPDRPLSYAEILNQLARTAGGSFVINEPYLAWGPVGVVVCLFLLGTVLASIDLAAPRSFRTAAALMFVASLPRLVLYGWSVSYKYLLTGVILYYASYWLSELLLLGAAPNRSCPEDEPISVARLPEPTRPGAAR